jgi:ubiquinone/menaquinone biosynthesis C-methylase UbiE
MALGDSQFSITSRRILRLYGKLVGISDFHTHFRWKAVEKVIDFQAKSTLEVGAGTGVMAFEFAKRARNGKIVASEFDDASVKFGKKIIRKSNYENVEFIQKDLRRLGLQENFDQVLAIDVLEHIDDDLVALKEINAALKPKGLLIISVPTPLYPKYFGKEFADKIGHVRDGYFIEELNKRLQGNGFRVLKYNYYTRYWASLFCSLFYRTKMPTAFKLLWLPIGKYLALFMDQFSTNAHATSLCVLAEKVSDLEEGEL